MKQGILAGHRVRLLMSKGHSCFRPRRTGERKRKSARGCIVGPDLAVIALSVVKKGDQDIPGLTDTEKPRRLGPKRAGNIRKMFALRKKKDDVRRYVVKREIKKNDKTFYKSPHIQRLITDKRLRRKKVLKSIKVQRFELAKKNKKTLNAQLKEYFAQKKQQKKDKMAAAAPAVDAKKDQGKKEQPKKEAPKKEAPKKEAPKKEAPKKEAPKKEAPKKEAP